MDPYAGQRGYGNQGYGNQGYGNPNGYGAANNGFAPVQMQLVHHQHNSAATGSVVVGALAFGLSLVGLFPGSPVFYYSVGGIIAIIGGSRAIMRRRQGFGTSVVRPIIAIVLGSLAVLFMLMGILIHSTVGLGTTGSDTSNTTSNAGAPQAGDEDPTATVPTAPSFASDANLSGYEQTSATVAGAIDTFANGGLAFSSHPSWPAAVTVMSDGTVTVPSGTLGVKLPAGEQMRYVVSSDHTSFEVIVSGTDQQEFAIYDSGLNAFTWTCAQADASCPPGGVSGDQGGNSGTTTNS